MPPDRSSRSFAMPKSSTLTRMPPGAASSGTRKRLSGLRSRWTIPLPCAAASAEAVCMIDVDGLARPASRRAASRCARLSPSRNSIIRYGIPDRQPSDVDDVDDVRVADGVRGARLVHEALDQPAILGELAAQHLDGRLAPHERVFGQVDGAHPAFPEQHRHLVVVDRLAYHARATIRPVFEGRVKSLSGRNLSEKCREQSDVSVATRDRPLDHLAGHGFHRR